MASSSEFIDLAEARRIAPILNTEGLKAVLHEPLKGYCDPAGVTQAYAKAARDMGAKVHRFTPVVETKQTPDGEWDVITPAGTIHAQFLVNAAGLWAREVAAMAGIKLPLLPVEHHYMVTETISEIADMKGELPNISEPERRLLLAPGGQGSPARRL